VSEYTEEELMIKLAKPFITFSLIEKKLDENARKLGYENHKDLLHKTGWTERFSIESN
jgi:hypothetical protein